MLLVIDNVDEAEGYLTLVGDGTDKNIQIPTAMISQADGKALKSALLQDKAIFLSFDFPNIPTDHTLKVELWLSSNNLASYNSLDKIKKAFELIDSNYQFIPKYVVLERDLLAE